VINKCTTFEDPIASFIPNMGRTTKSLQIRVVLVWGCRGPDRSQPTNSEGAHAESSGALGGISSQSHDMGVRVVAWRSGNVVGSIIEVTLRRARLVLRWVTAFAGIPSQVCN